MAVAKCEGSLENRTEEAAALINASNQFLVAEEKLLTCHCVSPNLEHLQVRLNFQFTLLIYSVFILIANILSI